MKISKGILIYQIGHPPVTAEGFIFDKKETDDALKSRLPSILFDYTGKNEVEQLLSGIIKTSFQEKRFKEIFNSDRKLESWRIGEAFAEAYLTDHKNCVFPWPGSRDLKNSDSSPAGADLVGFQKVRNNSVCFVFGEVKTSYEKKWPPHVMHGRSGLKKQIEDLRDNTLTRDGLVRYLAFHAKNSSWENDYKKATEKYIKNASDVTLFGILIRDVEPKEDDFKARVNTCSSGCPQETTVNFMAIYLPDSIIQKLPDIVNTQGIDKK